MNDREQYVLHLAVERCPNSCISWLDDVQAREAETELQRVIDGIETIETVAMNLGFMLARFQAENKRTERELAAIRNRIERTNASRDERDGTKKRWW